MKKRKSSSENLSAMAKEAMKLKKELQKLVDLVLEEDDYGTDEAEKAITTLSALKELKFRKLTSSHSKGKGMTVPDDFLCPISGQLMINPVAVASGETYDEQFIQKWFREVSGTCPKTKKFLNNTELTPNRLVEKLIKRWCRANKMELPNPVPDQDDQDYEEETARPADRAGLDELLHDMSSSSLSIQKQAAKELREITAEIPDFRELFSSDDFFRMLKPLISGSADVDPVLREDLVSTIYNISTDPENRKIVGECPAVLPILNASLLYGTVDGKCNSAAAIGLLAELDSNKVLIGKSGALKNLIRLFEEADESVIRDVSEAMFVLCENLRNRAQAVEEGLIWVVFEKLMSRVVVEELLGLLKSRFVGHRKAVEEMVKLGAVPLCFDLIRDSSSSVGAKENALGIISSICSAKGSQWKWVEEEEETYGTLSEMVRNAPSETMKRATVLLLRSKPCSSTTPQKFQSKEGCSTPFLKR